MKEEGLEGERPGPISVDCNFRRSIDLESPRGNGMKSKAILDCSKVRMISDCSFPSLPSSFLIVEERTVCVVKEVGSGSNSFVLLGSVDMGRKEQEGEGVCEPIVKGEFCSGGVVFLMVAWVRARCLGELLLSLEREVWVPEGWNWCHMLVWMSEGLDRWSSGRQNEEFFFKLLGWVQELVDDGW